MFYFSKLFFPVASLKASLGANELEGIEGAKISSLFNFEYEGGF